MNEIFFDFNKTLFKISLKDKFTLPETRNFISGHWGALVSSFHRL